MRKGEDPLEPIRERSSSHGGLLSVVVTAARMVLSGRLIVRNHGLTDDTMGLHLMTWLTRYR